MADEYVFTVEAEWPFAIDDGVVADIMTGLSLMAKNYGAIACSVKAQKRPIPEPETDAHA